MTKYLSKFVLIFLLGTISSSTCIKINFANYEKVSLKDQCSFNGDNENHSQILQLASMNNNPNTEKSASIFYSYRTHKFYNNNSTKSFMCTFTVITAPGEHIYATIQSMTFKSNPDGRCLDYIKFYDEHGFIHIYCGKHKKKNIHLHTNQMNSYHNFHDNKIFPENNYLTFDAKNVELKVVIFISPESLAENLQNNLMVTFTSYTKKESHQSKYKINKIYKCDGIENCNGFDCNDENNCTTMWVKPVSIIYIILIIFWGIVAIVNVCQLWTNHKLCCNSNHQENNNTSQSTDNLPREIFLIESDNHQVTPPVDTLPSYESIFPNQSSNANENSISISTVVTNPIAEDSQFNTTTHI